MGDVQTDPLAMLWSELAISVANEHVGGEINIIMITNNIQSSLMSNDALITCSSFSFFFVGSYKAG